MWVLGVLGEIRGRTVLGKAMRGIMRTSLAATAVRPPLWSSMLHLVCRIVHVARCKLHVGQ